MKALLAALVLMTAVSANAAVKCEFLNVVTKQPIKFTADSKSEVIDKAATACFNMYEQLTLNRTGHGLQDDEAGVTVANTCTNICG